MKKLTSSFLVFILVLLTSMKVQAQTFKVYSVKGEITMNGKKVDKGQVLTATSIVRITKDARMVVFSESDKKMYTIKTAGTKQLDKFIKDKECSIQQITDSYLSFLKNKLSDNDTEKSKNHMQSAGTAYRETDSTLVDILVPEEEENNE